MLFSHLLVNQLGWCFCKTGFRASCSVICCLSWLLKRPSVAACFKSVSNSLKYWLPSLSPMLYFFFSLYDFEPFGNELLMRRQDSSLRLFGNGWGCFFFVVDVFLIWVIWILCIKIAVTGGSFAPITWFSANTNLQMPAIRLIICLYVQLNES